MPRLPIKPIKPLRTPYYVPAYAIEDIDEFVKRKPTRPAKIRPYKRSKNCVASIGTAVAPPSLFMQCTMIPDVDLVMPSISRMHVVPKGTKRKLFLMDQTMTDIKSPKKERKTPTKSKVQKNKIPRVVQKSKSAVAAKIAKAPTIKKEANCTTPAAPKLTIRLQKARASLSKIDLPAEYEIVCNWM